MLTPLEITFHGLERSDAVETRAREKFARLEKRFDRITHGRVVVEAPRRRASAPKIFNVTIEIGVPGHNPIIVKHEAGNDGQEDVMLALRDAFAAATRQVDEIVDKMAKPARREQTRRRPRQASESATDEA